MLPKKNEQELRKLAKSLNLEFKNWNLWFQAFVHSSADRKIIHTIGHNERLEFVGDSIIGFLVSTYLFVERPSLNEGGMTKIQNYLVSEIVLSEFSRQNQLNHYLIVCQGKEGRELMNRDSVLCDLTESVVGTIYFECGLEKVREIFMPFVFQKFKDIQARKELIFDYKSELQYLFQKVFKKCPEYHLVQISGIESKKEFTSLISFNDKIITFGKGFSKKKSEQQAAKEAFFLIQNQAGLFNQQEKIVELITQNEYYLFT